MEKVEECKTCKYSIDKSVLSLNDKIRIKTIKAEMLIESLAENEIFVFGSNEAGIHGAGAAKFALDKFGAVYRQGFGLYGQSFAIPTKDKNIKTLPIHEIKTYVKQFIEQAKLDINKDKIFLVTEIGCGLAGYTPMDIAPLFKDAVRMDNIKLPEIFFRILTHSYIVAP